MQRIVVVGGSGSGKTTLARRLAETLDLSHLELDSVFHRHGWADEAPVDFRPVVENFARGDRWVVDGGYTSHGTREVLWPRADTFVWLDLPRRTAMGRVTRRTLRRVTTREALWEGGVKEKPSNLFRLDPGRNIILWTWVRHRPTREKYEAVMGGEDWAHADVHRLRTGAEVRGFLRGLSDRPLS